MTARRPDDDQASPISPPSVNPIPALRALRQFESPAIVKVFDRIRRALHDADGFEEFCWFAREYPRCYRFHTDAAQHRLESVHHQMNAVAEQLLADMKGKSSESFEHGVSGRHVDQIYWDFESFLSEVCISLDMLARVVSPAFQQQAPPSFSKLCRWPFSHPLLDSLRRAQGTWVQLVKDYRDCFVHYTPVDTLLIVSLRHYPDGWQLRAPLPTNPNAREILGFRYSKRRELLTYAVRTYAALMTLDRQVARKITMLFNADQFPKRREGLFYVGRRQRA